jgi:hypothetical protein
VQRAAFIICLAYVVLATSLYTESASVKYSFPDMWEWRPTSQPKEWASVNFWKLANNDILISYSSINNTKVISETITFFNRHKFQNREEAFGVPPGAIHPDPIIGYSAMLPNGKIVSPNWGSHCSRGIGAQIRVYDSQNNLLKTKTLLLVLDKPRYVPGIICEEAKVRGFSQRLVVFQPNQVVPLSDNTFLVSDLVTGTVIRLDENLNTKSSLLGKYLFMVDPIVLDNRLKVSGHGFDWEKFFEDLRIEMTSKTK